MSAAIKRCKKNVVDYIKSMSIQSLLIELNMESYVDRFVKENVDLDILKSLEDAGGHNRYVQRTWHQFMGS